MVVHRERLNWVGNFDWLLQQDLQEFFCYRQHDDITTPEFFEVLLQAADMEPNPAAVLRLSVSWRTLLKGAHRSRGTCTNIGSTGERSYT